MPNAIGGVTLRNTIAHEEILTFYLTDTVTEATADAGTLIDQPVCLDTSANNSVRLVGATDEDGLLVIGVIKSVEPRTVEGITVVAVLVKGGAATIPYKSGDAVAVGDAIVASDTAGKVKRVASPTALNRTQVVAKDSVAGTVDVIFW